MTREQVAEQSRHRRTQACVASTRRIATTTVSGRSHRPSHSGKARRRLPGRSGFVDADGEPHEAALRLGFLTAEQFDARVRAEHMVHARASRS